MLINALYQVDDKFYDIQYILDYRKTAYLYPKQNIKCSLCLTNQITKEEEYIVCYLCSTKKKNFYLCSSCTKFVVNENGQTIHEHPLLLVQKGAIQLVKKMSQFKAIQYYSPDNNERLNCRSCQRAIDYYYWTCGYCGYLCLCPRCFRKIRKSKRDLVEKGHPYIRVRKGWTLLSTIDRGKYQINQPYI